MTQQTTGPDVGQLAAEKLPKIEFPGGKGESFRIFIEPQTHEEIWKHANEDTTVEICGVLVGVWGCDGDGPFALISASIRGAAAANKFAEVTFTHETWATINTEMDGKYSDRAIVGWYPTHPDTHELTHPDITIQTCWDADRLDLGRVEIRPHPSRLCTKPAKSEEMIFWADGRASFRVVPSFVARDWGAVIEE